jgi:sugar phosphate isomerase/epimerase
MRVREALRAQFQGTLAIHGPFLGMEYAHLDHMIRGVVQRRLDQTFEAALTLKASRVILHSGYTIEMDLFKLQDQWLTQNIAFWHREIQRWADVGIQIVLENDIERSPDLLVQLVSQVDHTSLGLCMDIGHQHMFSDLDAQEWVQRMASRLLHIHVHDNDRTGDNHWRIGRGTIDFESFYSALRQYVPQATIALEVQDTMEVKIGDLRALAAAFASQ